jgi:energy-coupling factor transport system substrate-specific component
LSWQLVSFALVLVSLAFAFWWYERSHPPAKLLAVVATLAAIAALGRDAFAAVPDVKPITAIVLVSGVAFGAGPGFAVGAIAALASNILLGEGPWTPWQMLGWGLVGLIGAGLGRLSSRRLPTLALALACAVSAEVFNLVVNLYTWTATGNHTLAGFGVVLGSAAVFDVTHILASFAFGLAFGGVLLRMLTRVRSRLEVSWEPAGTERHPGQPDAPPSLLAPLSTVALLVAIPLLAMGAPTAARATTTAPRSSARAFTRAVPATASAAEAPLDISREVAFLAGAQNSDGGFGAASGQASSELYSAWVAIGLAAAGRDPLSLRRGGHTVLDAIRGEASSLQGAGDLERTILALHACGVSVHSLPGGDGADGDPVARLLRFRDSDGSFGDLSNLTVFAIFALRAAGYHAGDTVVRGAGRWLQRQQEPDGGFGFGTRGGGSDVDDTAAVLQAVVDAGVRTGPVLAHAVAFLIHAQNLDGGYPQQPGGESNAQSTAWAIQGLVAAGRDVGAITRQGSRSPLGYLESLLAPNGSVHYSRTSAQTPVWVTAQALTALAGKPFPIAPVRR